MKVFSLVFVALVAIYADKISATTSHLCTPTTRMASSLSVVPESNLNELVSNEPDAKFVKDLDEEELCAYKILKRLIKDASVDKRKIVFFYKVDIFKKDGVFEISTSAKTQMIGFKSPSGSTVLNYSIVLKNRIISEPGLPKDSVFVGSASVYRPQYKIINIGKCGRFEWEIVHRAQQYETRDTLNIDYAIRNPAQFQYLYYADKAYAIARKDGKYGVLDRNSNVLLPFKFSYMIKNEFGLLVHDNNIYYYMDPLTGKKLSKDYSGPNMTTMYKLKQNLSPVKRNGKMTLLNSKFEEIVPLVYDDIFAKGFGKNRILIGKRDGKWWIIDPLTGKEMGETALK